jgi:enolase
MPCIARVFAREVLDSRGRPTVEVEVTTDSGHFGRAIVPSGASTGSAEALELRDGDLNWYDGDGVGRAVTNVNETIGPALCGLDARDQTAIDVKLLGLDSTPQKSELGANAVLGASLAAAHAGAAAAKVPLYRHLNKLVTPRVEPRMPLPMINMISGGLHAGGNLDFQDVLISPHGAPSYRVGLEWAVRIYRRLGRLLSDEGYEGRLVGDEGGYGPRLESNRQAVEFVVRAIETAGLRPGNDVSIALDVAATHFFDGEGYRLASEGGHCLTAGHMIDRLAAWVDEFPIHSIEDGLAEDDWAGWQSLCARLRGKVRLVGDDLLATNPARVKKAIELGAATAVLVKMNQIGTLTETFDTIRVAREAGLALVISARSGETEDTSLADLAVAAAGEQIKIGSIVRSERLAKYNRLLRIEGELQSVPLKLIHII